MLSESNRCKSSVRPEGKLQDLEGHVGHGRLSSRRSFLRAALAAPIAGMVGSYSPPSGQERSGEASAIVARVTLDHELYNCDALLNGRVHFRLPVAGPVIVRWMDSFGRTVHEFQPPSLVSTAAPQNFSFELDRGFVKLAWTRRSHIGKPANLRSTTTLVSMSSKWPGRFLQSITKTSLFGGDC